MTLHHPSEATMLAYAAGLLPTAHAVVVRTHLALCEACRDDLRLGEELGGAMLESLAPAELAPDALQRTLAKLDRPVPPSPTLRAVPTTVAAFATGRWWWIAPGVRLMPLLGRGSDDTRLDLIRVAPGMAMPAHGHTGNELNCVLQGAFRDETGEYRAGDLAESDAAVEHQSTALPVGEACVCLISTRGRLRAHGLVARLLQPLIGF